jgi:hypothetical protein
VTFRDKVMDALSGCNLSMSDRDVADAIEKLHEEAVAKWREAAQEVVDDCVRMTTGDGDEYNACGIASVDTLLALLSADKMGRSDMLKTTFGTIGRSPEREREAGLEAQLADLQRRGDELAEIVQQVSNDLSWHTDDDANPNDESPEDATAWTNGIARQRLTSALSAWRADKPKCQPPATKEGR